jgi:hypothetical protein
MLIKFAKLYQYFSRLRYYININILLWSTGTLPSLHAVTIESRVAVCIIYNNFGNNGKIVS